MKNARTALALVISLVLLLPACRKETPASRPKPVDQAYGAEADWNDPARTIALNYREAQGQRLFYQDCVWCHADSTPAGPSNRSNVNPTPALMNDGAVLNRLSDEYLKSIITLGGSAVGKSAMMPPWGRARTPEEIQAMIAYIRAIASPPPQPESKPESQYLVK